MLIVMFFLAALNACAAITGFQNRHYIQASFNALITIFMLFTLYAKGL